MCRLWMGNACSLKPLLEVMNMGFWKRIFMLTLIVLYSYLFLILAILEGEDEDS